MKPNMTLALDDILGECGTNSKKWLKKLSKGAVNLDYAFETKSGESYIVKAKWKCIDVEIKLIDQNGKDVVVH